MHLSPAENVAKRWNVSREEQDRFAVYSQQKTANAQRGQHFKEELIPILNLKVPLQTDEFPRNDTSLEGLHRLKPCFLKVSNVLEEFCLERTYISLRVRLQILLLIF